LLIKLVELIVDGVEGRGCTGITCAAG
jgi:hypothetical protein